MRVYVLEIPVRKTIGRRGQFVHNATISHLAHNCDVPN